MRDQLMSDAGLRQKVAESSPNELLREFSFWRRQPDLFIIVAATALAFYLLAPYTYEFAHGWVFLTIAVQLLALWGVIIAARSLAKIEVETAIVYEIELKGSEYLREIKSNQRQRAELDDLEQSILPNNAGEQPPAMIRLFQHICKEARDRKFESSVNVIQPYKEEPLEDIFKLQNLQKIALWLGILGTFIGLLLAIQVGNLNGADEGQDFLAIIRGMFENLFISFSASLAGLEVAVLLGFLLLLLRKRQETYFKGMESAVVTMLSLARNAINKDDFMVEFNQVNASVSQLSDRVYNQTEELSKRILEVQQQVKGQTIQIQTGIKKLSTTSAEFDSFLGKVSEKQQQFISEVQSLYDMISLKNLGTTLQATVIDAGKHISDSLNSSVTQISSQLLKFNDSVNVLGATMQNQAVDVTGQIKKLDQKVSNQLIEHADIMKGLVTQMRKDAERESKTTSRLMSELNHLSQRLAELSKTIENTRYLTPRRQRIWDFLSSLK